MIELLIIQLLIIQPLNFYSFMEPFTELFTKLSASLGPELLSNEQARATWTGGKTPRGRFG